MNKLPKVQRFRWGAQVILISAIMSVACLGLSGAKAGASSTPIKEKCTPIVSTPPGPGAEVCVDIDNAVNEQYVTPVLISFTSDFTDQPKSGTIVLWQCDGLGHNCGNIASNGQPGSAFWEHDTLPYSFYLITSRKPYSPGHVYKACGSLVTSTGQRVTNLCTDPLF